MTAPYIVIEGTDYAGKTTVINRLKTYFSDQPICFTKEPGSTTLGIEIRKWVLSESNTTKDVQRLLFTAAAIDGLVNLVKPALANNVPVISDRGTASTFVYQRDTPLTRTCIELVHSHAIADVIIVLHIDYPTKVKRQQVDQERIDNHFDYADEQEHNRRLQTYYDFAESGLIPKDRMVFIDASGDVEHVFLSVVEVLKRYGVVRHE